MTPGHTHHDDLRDSLLDAFREYARSEGLKLDGWGLRYPDETPDGRWGVVAFLPTGEKKHFSVEGCSWVFAERRA